MRSTLGTIAAIGLSLTPSPVPAEMQEWRPDLIAKYESTGGQNVPNWKFDGVRGPHSAGGACQMLTSTYLPVAKSIDIDIEKFPVLGTLNEFDQWRVCWKLWSTKGYEPWTCCNTRLKKVLSGDSVNVTRHAPVNKRKTDQPPEQADAFLTRFSASSDIYHVMPIASR